MKWSALPEGLVVADKPEKLDDALVGLLLFMRWPTPYGWQVGKITSKITAGHALALIFHSFATILYFDVNRFYPKTPLSWSS